jgi:adenine-specific DNA-methyltransferase
LAYYKNASSSDAAIGHVIDPNTREDSNLWKGLADNNINKNNPENPPDFLTLPVGFPSEEENLFYPKKVLPEAFFEITTREKFVSDEVKEEYGIEKLSGLPVKLDDMVVRDNRLVQPCRIYGGLANRAKLLEFIKNGCEPIRDETGAPLRFYLNANAAVRYQKENEKPRNILSVLRNLGTTERARGLLKQIGIDYDYPKPVPLISYLVKVGCEPEDGIVLDFFAGSGATAEAVFEVNSEANARRKFILVQLPESTRTMKDDGTWIETISWKAGYRTLSEITVARVRKIMQPANKRAEGRLAFSGGAKHGFRLLKLAPSNFSVWNATTETTAPDALEQQLELHIDHIQKGRTSEDLLYEILLKSGFPLTTPVETFGIDGKAVHSVANGAMLICLALNLTHETIKGIADLKPERVVCLDEGFAGNDQLKTNAVLIMKSKGVTKFQTI